MVHIFEERNFKSYLHRNCVKVWFAFGEETVQYEDQNGVHSANPSGKVTVPVPGIIRDPILNKEGMTAQAVGGGVVSAISGVMAGVLATPFTGGASLALSVAAAANAGVTGVASAALLEERNRPEDVYFNVVYGYSVYDTEWVAKNVSPGGVWQVANNVVQWSNQVFRERYVDKKSSEFQSYIEQRPPTPTNWPPSSKW
ncbi:hypothetical protein [endosymbiont GvMRE of Glomus versiforme]|uniref:hypothetical protein n=1 Tax=endosymbiont GvMRE of Glomus versiforme TaxID=2039283 RepID=UPI000ED182FE|nr:hypothetical protein [endosymbiont GvMRE of Glomus versiforme]RHZ36766.1 hypothetical protein GvMRE_I2g156 [endosymbiont GvMRE of Glomus versiforme]